MKDIIRDLVNHTAGLGFIDSVKVNDDSHGYTLKNYIEYLAKEI